MYPNPDPPKYKNFYTQHQRKYVGTLNKKFQMLFDQNIASNVTRKEDTQQI